MQFNRLDKKALLAYIESDVFNKAQNIAITTHRALSQMNNPRLMDDDVLLITISDGEQMAGYVGVLSDDLDMNGVKVHFGWLSALWVNPDFRGKGLGQQLIAEALDSWDGKILSADYVLETKPLYDKTDQFQANPFVQHGVRLYLKSDLKSLLPPKGFPFNKLLWLLGGLDLGLNLMFKLKPKIQKSISNNFRVELVDEVDEEMNQFIIQNQQSELTKRSMRELNWMLKNPWVIPVSEDRHANKYHFTSSSQVFENKVIKIYSEAQQLCAVMIFSIRNNSCKLLYLYHNDCIKWVAEAINNVLVEWEVSAFTCFHSDLAKELMSSKTSAILRRKQIRNYLISTKLDGMIKRNQNAFQGGDGDVGFT